MNTQNVYSITIYSGTMLLSVIFFKIYSCHKVNMRRWMKMVSYFLIACPFAFVIGLRDISVGADTRNYIRILLNYKSETYGEVFFRYLVKILYNLKGKFPNYTYLFLIYVFLTLLSVIYIIDMYSDDVNMPLFLFVFYCFFGLNMGDQMRQIAALPVTFGAFLLFSQKRKTGAIILSGVAGLIHTSAILALIFWMIAYFIGKSEKVVLVYKNKKVVCRPRIGIIVISIISLVAIGYRIIFPILAIILPQNYSNYFTTRVNIQEIGVGFLLDILPIFLAIHIAIHEIDMTRTDEWFYAYAMLAIPFRLVGYYSFFAARISYYNIIVALYFIIKKSKGTKRNLMILVIGCIYYIFYYLYLDLHGMFPYRSVI